MRGNIDIQVIRNFRIFKHIKPNLLWYVSYVIFEQMVVVSQHILKSKTNISIAMRHHLLKFWTDGGKEEKGVWFPEG